MSKRAYLTAAAVAVAMSTGALAQQSGSAGTSSPTGANSRAATSAGLPDRPDPRKAEKARRDAMAKKAKKAGQQNGTSTMARDSMTAPR